VKDLVSLYFDGPFNTLIMSNITPTCLLTLISFVIEVCRVVDWG